ncbi:hypothetical protein PP175_27155 (plasmid) [Aneurinibacillus sp. Ricciae_BoGa-3]|uniref:hypothetical protein n=1 Tax=Aneurinibacillus sp. Ricciae_BoGa-3 TaxID=3022697 RepID=UPI00233FFAC0|nr:hypothetical protein [Aneurinibacillus sp. Ricciae_BoGa-3]WCK57718.1 hypothetical protein PP175_27155 [Aneurinibacillus sp. Ricciae_BoGa-3]
MAKPPVNPLPSKSGSGMSYFKALSLMAREYLKADGITLNFQGYTETIIDYANMQENDIHTAWRLTKELNAWSEYFASISNLIQKFYLDAETDKIEIQATASIKADAVKVANGERLSNKDSHVIQARKKRNCLKAFYDELESKIKFLERGYYHCKATCDWANKPIYNNNQSPQAS